MGIRGRVVDQAGNPIEDICASPASASAPFSEDSSRGSGNNTSADGQYFVDLDYPGYMPPAGSPWSVEFWDCRTSPVFAPTVVNFKQPEKGEVITINAVLKPGGSIEGTITDQLGVPDSGVCVDDFSGRFGYGLTERMIPDYIVHSDDHGHFRVSGLSLGPQRLLFGFCTGSAFHPTWFKDQPVHCYFDDCNDAELRSNYDAANPISVTAGTTSDVGQVILDPAAPNPSPSAS